MGSINWSWNKFYCSFSKFMLRILAYDLFTNRRPIAGWVKITNFAIWMQNNPSITAWSFVNFTVIRWSETWGIYSQFTSDIFPIDMDMSNVSLVRLIMPLATVWPPVGKNVKICWTRIQVDPTSSELVKVETIFQFVLADRSQTFTIACKLGFHSITL